MLPAALLLLGTASACNSDKDNEDEEIAVTSSTVAVKNFYLQANSSVLADLDSVFFSIDLTNGVIFNADSLPKGTDVTKLIPVITFVNSMSAAEIEMSGGDVRTGTVDYLENPSDSIDFSGDVTLKVTAADGVNKYSYRLKVNVHKELPDSMIWDRLAHSPLPSRLPEPVAQKSVTLDGTVYTLIEERDASLTLALSENISEGKWEREPLTLPFTPDIKSLTAPSDTFWMLAQNGDLYKSADARSWEPTGDRWLSITGPYMDCVLGIKECNGELAHCHYPHTISITDTKVSAEFPVSGSSALISRPNEWSPYPTAIVAGGTKADGQLSDHAWAFDGTRWTAIDNGGLPALKGAVLVEYLSFRKTSVPFEKKEYGILLLTGGIGADGTLNRTTYISYNNGVNWQAASEPLQLPDYFPQLCGADGIVLDSELSADLSAAWKKAAPRKISPWMKVSYEIDGDDITWDCPYIYFIGGTLPDGKLSSEIWRGVLARLSFKPLI